jgi:hypothetical protein
MRAWGQCQNIIASRHKAAQKIDPLMAVFNTIALMLPIRG